MQESSDERCYYCGPVGNEMVFENHVTRWGNMILCDTCSRRQLGNMGVAFYGQKENNDSAESNSVSTVSDSKGK
jgi:hypothetical protein